MYVMPLQFMRTENANLTRRSLGRKNTKRWQTSNNNTSSADLQFSIEIGGREHPVAGTTTRRQIRQRCAAANGIIVTCLHFAFVLVKRK